MDDNVINIRLVCPMDKEIARGSAVYCDVEAFYGDDSGIL